MESWRRTLTQFRDLFNNMAPSQRMTLVVVPLLVLAALGLVMYVGAGPAQESLLMGKVFSAEELKNAEAALRKGGLSQYKIEGQRIFAPRSEVQRYNAALITGDGVPDRYGEELGKAFRGNPLNFAPESQRRDELDFYKSMEVVNMIRAIPDIEEARLFANRPQKRGFTGESKMTATLSVRPRHGSELSPDLVHGLRQAVAGAFGMAPADVTVVNTKTGIAPRMPDKTDPSNNGYVDAIRSFKSMYQQTIAEALAYIPNALVSINIDLDPLVQSREQERKYEAKPFAYKNVEETESVSTSETGPGSEPGMIANQPRAIPQRTGIKNTSTTEKSNNSSESVPLGTRVTDRQLAGFTPRSVQVAVAIPRDYYRDVLLKRGTDEADKSAFEARITQLKVETEKEVREKVAKLIPVPAGGPPGDVVNVSSYDRLETAEAPVTVAMTTRIGEAVSQWGGPAGLTLFALWALWMLNRSMKRPLEPGGPAAAKLSAGKAAAAAAATDEDDDDQPPKELTKRDRLQALVKDNPEMAAAVLSRWLAPPK